MDSYEVEFSYLKVLGVRVKPFLTVKAENAKKAEEIAIDKCHAEGIRHGKIKGVQSLMKFSENSH